MKDLIILGNGMAGMTAALYAKRANLDFKIVGKDEYDFGQIGNAILVENYPCAGSVSGFDLAMKLHEQLEENEIKVEEHEVIKVSLDINTNNFKIKYNDGMDNAKTVIYALGASHRKLNCEIEEGIPIHYCALCDGSLYKDKIVAIIGGGDSAFTQAEYLSKICSLVYIIMCDDNITATPQTYKRVKNIENIKIVMNFPVALINKCHCNGYPKNSYMYKTNFLWTYNLRGGYRADGIFVAIGMIPNTQDKISIQGPLITDTFGYILTNENCETAIPGFFAAGDIRQKRMRQSITAAADGANAVQSVIDYLKNY